MRKQLRMTAATVMAALLTMNLTACGGGGNKTAQSTPETAKDGVQVVTFWHVLSGAQGEAFQKVIDTYNETRGKEAGIRVNPVYQGYEITDKLELAYQTKDTANAPDITWPLTSVIPTMMDMDWTVSVEKYLEKPDSEITKDTFYPSMQRACTYNGEMVGIPVANSTMLLYYNEDALKEAGYDRAPATFDELADYTAALTKKDESGNVSVYGLETQVKRYQLVNFCVSQNPDCFFGDHEGGRDGNMTKVTIKEDGTLKNFLEKWQKINETGGLKYILDKNKEAEEFAQGVCAMNFISSSKLSTVESLVDGSFEWKVAPIPKVSESDTSGASIGGSCLMMIDRGDQDRLDAAWDVIEYFSSPEAQYIFSTGTGYIPVNVETENLPEMKKFYEENPRFQVALEQMKNSSPNAQEPLDPVRNDMDTVIADTMLQFCQGELDVDAAVDQIVNSCNDLLDEYYEANN